MFQVAGLVGKLLGEAIQQRESFNGEEGQGRFTASVIVAGQIKGMEPRLFPIYPEGSFIEASFDTPFFQISSGLGEALKRAFYSLPYCSFEHGRD